MNASRKLMRIWLTISSFIGFIAGWVFLSHTVETKNVTQVGSTIVEMPVIQAVPTLNGLNAQGLDSNSVRTFSINPNPPQQSFSPSFRTGGS